MGSACMKPQTIWARLEHL